MPWGDASRDSHPRRVSVLRGFTCGVKRRDLAWWTDHPKFEWKPKWSKPLGLLIFFRSRLIWRRPLVWARSVVASGHSAVAGMFSMLRRRHQNREISVGARYFRRDAPNIIWEVLALYEAADGLRHVILYDVAHPDLRKTLSQFTLEASGQYTRVSESRATDE